MVTAIPQSAFHSPLLGDTTGSLTLRVQGTEHDGRILHIRSPKCLIGSDPSCTLRLRSTTVRPFHCLILRGTEGTFIRRWSPDTCLNGGGFDEARLSPGDRISIGAIELEVLPSASPADAPRGIAPPPENDPTSQTVCRDQLAAHSSLTSQAEAAASQAEALQEELDGLRHQLQEELRLAGNSRGHLEAELEFRSQQLFDAQTQLAALQCTRDEQFAQWQAHEKQWHEELEATRAQGEAFQREIETLRFQATEAAARAADHEVSPPAAGDNAADIATWKDVAEGLRRELQQTRDEHRQVREEWHVDRQNLERELNARSTAAQQLEQKYKQDMREAEVLIHAMQQEGKHLLIQLDEAKQSIRQGTEGNKKKRPSLVHTVRSLVVDGALPSTLAVTQVVPHSPPAEQPPVVPPEDPRPPRQSACPTMLMSSQLAFDEPESPPPPAAELPPVEPHVPTLALNPDDLPRVILPPAQPLAEESASGMAADPPLAEKPAADASPAAGHDQEPEDDEHVIQRYMERLLRRVARVPDDQNTPTRVVAAVQAVAATSRPESASAVESAAKTAEPAAKQVEPLHEPVRDIPAPPAAPELCPVKEAEARPARVAPPISKPLAKPRDVIPPELAADLLAMRELANRTARRDIDRSDDRRNTVAAGGEIAVASVCLVSGALASALSSSFFSAEAIGGAMGISFGAIFLIRGLRTCIRLRKKSSEARKDTGS